MEEKRIKQKHKIKHYRKSITLPSKANFINIFYFFLDKCLHGHMCIYTEAHTHTHNLFF